MDLRLIAALGTNGAIGNNGKIPWASIPEDIDRFKNLTMGHPVIMGRVTYLSIPEKYRPLKGRENIVLSQILSFEGNGIHIARSIDQALEIAKKFHPPIYVIGGQKVYEQTIGLASRLELTRIGKDYEGDAFFPQFNIDDWNPVDIISRSGYSFVSYERRSDKKQ